MTRENFLKEQIKNKGSMKEFASKIDMPYTTLLSILKNVGGASIDNIFKICRGLNITTEALENCSTMSSIPPDVPADEAEAAALYRQLDTSDRGEIRGEMKQMLKADKYGKVKNAAAI